MARAAWRRTSLSATGGGGGRGDAAPAPGRGGGWGGDCWLGGGGVLLVAVSVLRIFRTAKNPLKMK